MPVAVTGLTWRGQTAYWQRQHERLPGRRVVRSLGVTAERPDLAGQYAAALNTLMERGDWTVIARWAAGELHITDVARAVREGDYTALARLNAAGLRLGEVVPAYLRRAEATLSASRNANLRSVAGALLEDFGADLPMHTLTTSAAEAWLHAPKDTAGGRTWAANTQGERRTIAKAIWAYARQLEDDACTASGAVPLLTRNPWSRARVPEHRRTRFAYLQKAEARAFFAHERVRGTPAAAFAGVGVYAGLRDAEIRHLRPGVDVDLERAVVVVQSRGGEYPWRPKTQRSERSVPIPAALVELLETHVASGFAGTRYLFRQPGQDRPITGVTSRKWVRLAFAAAGLRYGRRGDALTIHSLRHTYATWLLSGGVPLPTVARLLGDTNETVLKTYAHAIPEDLSRALAVLEQASGRRPKVAQSNNRP